eukprot:12411563-Karenia_brevis.AAC.1
MQSGGGMTLNGRPGMTRPRAHDKVTSINAIWRGMVLNCRPGMTGPRAHDKVTSINAFNKGNDPKRERLRRTEKWSFRHHETLVFNKNHGLTTTEMHRCPMIVLGK